MNEKSYQFDGTNIRQCTFFFDTSFGENYLSEETLEILGYQKQSSSFPILINNVKTEANSHTEDYLKDINILGMRFCVDSKLDFHMNFVKLPVLVSFKLNA